jgi:Asp-tRNA(Asn)/Glu-tRNA(Gln) amidotransferase A subunit family amidase
MLHELATAVRDGRIHPRELVAESLRRIDAATGLNAVITRDDEAALVEADAVADDPVRRGGALAGVPVLVKDLTRVAGMRTTLGSVLEADAGPDERDDTVAARLRAAGAIVIGKTNTPSYGHTAVTDNLVFGATRNPWNPQRSPGGSSGGSAAALAAGLVPLATTTDGGGSVRIPAALCGLVGYKPTLGVIGRDAAPRWLGFSTAGATNATVADVLVEARVLAGPTTTDIHELPPGSVPIETRRPERVVACRTFRADVDPAVEAAFDATVAAIGDDLGIAVEVVDRVFTRDDLAFQWFLAGSAELAQSLAAVRDRWDAFEPTLQLMLQVGEAVTLPDYLAAQRVRYQVAAELEELVAGTDDRPPGVLITPTLNVTSWAPEGPLPDTAGAVHDDPAIAVNTMELNMTGHPGVSVPMGIGPEGVPIGLQIAAPRFADALALGLAAALEQARPWPATAPGHDPFPQP